jgi:hypothetical protein
VAIDPDKIRLHADLEDQGQAIPEVKLAVAVIVRAILDAISNRNSVEPAIVRSAEAWLTSDVEKRYSFYWLTERLFEAGPEVRAQIRSIIERRDRKSVQALFTRVKF